MMRFARLRLILGEAVRNLRVIRPLVVVELGFLALVAIAVVGIDYQTVRSQLSDQAAFVDAGGYVLVVAGTIDSNSCRDMSKNSRVRRVGAARYPPVISLRIQPGRTIPVIEVAGDAIVIWANGPRPIHEIAVGTLLRKDLSNPALASLAIVDGNTVRVGSTVPPSRNPQAARALMVPVAWAGTFDECWIEFAAIGAELAADLAGTISAGPEAAIRVLATRSPGDPPIYTRFAARPTEWAWLIGALVTGLFVSLGEFSRRPEHALYAILGWRPSEIVLRRLVEFLAVQLLAQFVVACLFVGSAVLVFQASGFELSLAVDTLFLLTSAELAAAAIVVAVTMPHDLITTLRNL